MTERSCYPGGCHCGNLRYVFSTSQASRDWSVRRCTCSYCLRLAARYTSGADTSLEVAVQDSTTLARYEFATRTAEFFRCGKCGVMIFAGCELADRRFAVLNVNTLDNSSELDLNVVDMDFDGEQVGDRLARRRRNWIPDVSIRFVDS